MCYSAPQGTQGTAGRVALSPWSLQASWAWPRVSARAEPREAGAWGGGGVLGGGHLPLTPRVPLSWSPPPGSSWAGGHLLKTSYPWQDREIQRSAARGPCPVTNTSARAGAPVLNRETVLHAPGDQWHLGDAPAPAPSLKSTSHWAQSPSPLCSHHCSHSSCVLRGPTEAAATSDPGGYAPLSLGSRVGGKVPEQVPGKPAGRESLGHQDSSWGCFSASASRMELGSLREARSTGPSRWNTSREGRRGTERGGREEVPRSPLWGFGPRCKHALTRAHPICPKGPPAEARDSSPHNSSTDGDLGKHS